MADSVVLKQRPIQRPGGPLFQRGASHEYRADAAARFLHEHRAHLSGSRSGWSLTTALLVRFAELCVNTESNSVQRIQSRLPTSGSGPGQWHAGISQGVSVEQWNSIYAR